MSATKPVRRHTAKKVRYPVVGATSVQPTDAVESTPQPVEASVPREAMIAEAAYYRAEKRGFAPGYELDDWLAAEAEITGCGLQQESTRSAIH